MTKPVEPRPWPREEGASVVARWLATAFLRFAEFLFLLAYGWRRTDGDAAGEVAWQPPDGHPKAGDLYGRTHAVNSTRYYLGARWTSPRRRSDGRRPRRTDSFDGHEANLWGDDT